MARRSIGSRVDEPARRPDADRRSGLMPRSRLTRSERAALTRHELLEAAEGLFYRDGYHGTTLEAIAEDAGYTTGAVYSAFDNKADLFLALVDIVIHRRMKSIATLFDGRPEGQSMLSALAERQIDQRDDQWFLVMIEFCVHAAREPVLREQVAVRYRRVRAGLARMAIEGTPLGADGWALVTLALANGLTIERLIEPHAVPADVMAAAQRLLYPPRPG